MKKLYLFDFDGTITHKDTMFMYLKFYNSRRFYRQFLKHSPLFVMVKLGLANAENVKKSFISSLLKGESRSAIEEKSKRFFTENFPGCCRENALEFIRNINREQTESFLVTASLDIWVKPFADEFNMKLIATKAEFINDIFTGEFVGKNCNGEEKVNRILEELQEKKFDKTIAFGDTSGDRPMMNWANESHFEFFH